jgi:hypothetical protein
MSEFDNHEKILERLGNQHIKTQSWGYASTGTRFKVFNTPVTPRTAYFADCDPRLSDPVLLPAQRAGRRTDDPDKMGGLHIPAGVPYALTVTSDIPVLAQYSRLDTTQGAYTLMTATPTGRD